MEKITVRFFKEGKRENRVNRSSSTTILFSPSEGYYCKEAIKSAVKIDRASMVVDGSEWLVGSAMTHHVCNNRSLFQSFKESDKDEKIYTVYSDRGIKVEGVGKISLLLASGKILELQNVCYVPSMENNWLSVGLLTDDRFTVTIGSGRVVLEKQGRLFAMGFRKEGRYVLHGQAQLN